MFKNIVITIIISLSLLSSVKSESLDFKVIALFKNAVMIQHGNKQKTIRSGQTYLNQIRLVSADSHKAHFLINGKKVSLGLHQSKISDVNFLSDAAAEKQSIIIPVNNMGMFITAGFINGIQVNFLVDTGASQVAMNETTARRIGLQYKLKGQRGNVITASGRSSAWYLLLDKINVKGIELRMVEGVVVKGTGPSEVLLGMSFLKQLKMQNDGNLMRLTKKY